MGWPTVGRRLADSHRNKKADPTAAESAYIFA